MRIFLFTLALMRVLRVSSLSEEQKSYKIQEDNSASVNIVKQVPCADADKCCKSYSETATKCPKGKCGLGCIYDCDPLDGKCVYTENFKKEYSAIFIAALLAVCFIIFLIIAGLMYHREDDLEMKSAVSITEPVVSSNSIYSPQSREKLNDNNLNNLSSIETLNVKKYKLKTINSIEDNTIFDESFINNNQMTSMKNVNFPDYLREFDTEIIINEPAAV